MAIKLKPGMKIRYSSASGNEATASVGGGVKSKKGTLLVSWSSTPTDDDIAEFDEWVYKEADIKVDFSGRFANREDAVAAEMEYLKGGVVG